MIWEVIKMEHEYESYGYLLEAVRSAVRKKASSIISSGQKKMGCMRFSFTPLCQDAIKWSTRVRAFDPQDPPVYEYTFLLFPDEESETSYQAICSKSDDVEIWQERIPAQQKYCHIKISVSGMNEDQNLQCAREGIIEVRQFFNVKMGMDFLRMTGNADDI